MKRKLKDGESPQIGDVFDMFEGPFRTAIVTYVHADGSVDVERPMMQITGIVPSPAISVERIGRISSTAIRQYEFWTYRDKIDNHWYDKALLSEALDRGRVIGREDVAKYSRAIGEIEAALGIVGAKPLSETVSAVREVVSRAGPKD